jgi:hypothetical protein
MPVFNTIRLVVFGVTIGFSLIVMGIAANFLSTTAKYSLFGFGSVSGFAVATPVLTFVILIPALVLDFVRKGAVTSLTASELGFIGFLWILWLACASNTTSILSGITLDCTGLVSEAASFCSQYQALQAFSWLNWLILFFYWIALLVIALVAQSRGINKAFMLPTTELASSVPSGGNAGGEPKNLGYPPGGIPPSTYPPQGQYPQQSFTPSQYPQQTYTPGPMPPQGQMYQPTHVSSPAPQPSGAIQV